MLPGKKLLTVTFFLFIITALSGTAYAEKSLYVISDTEISQLQAYKIDGTSLVWQKDYVCRSAPGGGVGSVALTIDNSEYGQFLFVTFEWSDEIELVNAKTMQYVDTVTAPGADDLAGIAMDTGKSKLYAVDRYTNHLYSWSWNPVTKTLTPDFNYPYYTGLEGLVWDGESIGAFGIALDEENDLLYVGDNTNKIKYYDTNDWSKEGEISVSCNVIGVAIDVVRQLLYYGSMGSYGQGDIHLYQYDISLDVEYFVTVDSSVAGIVVEQQTGLVYITTYEDGSYPGRLMIYDSALDKKPWESGDIGNPAGVCVPTGDVLYKPPLFYLVKVDVNEPNSVLPDDYITYEITYGPNGVSDNNVVLTDYLPYEVDPNNPSDPNYNSSKHTYTWQIGSLSANDPNKLVTLMVKVNEGAAPDCNISNHCEIEGDTYCSFTTADTNVGYWEPNSEIIYVDSLSPCAPGTGMSWRFAYRDLQDALARARAGCGSQIYDVNWDFT